MNYGYYPLQNTLPFPDLPPVEDSIPAETMAQKTAANESDTTIESILGHKDSTLLFMTMTASMTSKNEMPIVRS